jgi:hypothetical protein
VVDLSPIGTDCTSAAVRAPDDRMVATAVNDRGQVMATGVTAIRLRVVGLAADTGRRNRATTATSGRDMTAHYRRRRWRTPVAILAAGVLVVSGPAFAWAVVRIARATPSESQVRLDPRVLRAPDELTLRLEPRTYRLTRDYDADRHEPETPLVGPDQVQVIGRRGPVAVEARPPAEAMTGFRTRQVFAVFTIAEPGQYTVTVTDSAELAADRRAYVTVWLDEANTGDDDWRPVLAVLAGLLVGGPAALTAMTTLALLVLPGGRGPERAGRPPRRAGGA